MLTRVVSKLLTGYSYFCDFLLFNSEARALSIALMVNIPFSTSIVEKSSVDSYCFSHSCVLVIVYTAILADALKPSERNSSHSKSLILPTKTNSVENDRITPE